MPRELTGHRINECNEALKIEVLDEPGAGGACHDYEITGFSPTNDPGRCLIQFQNGPIKEAGVNGVTHEALLAILIDRMEHFQAGEYACIENERALVSLGLAQKSLLERTRRRVAAGTEGTHEKD